MEVALLMVWLQLQACRNTKMSSASQARAAVQAVKELVQGLQDGESLEAVRNCIKRLGHEVQGLTDGSGEGVRLAAVSFLR